MGRYTHRGWCYSLGRETRERELSTSRHTLSHCFLLGVTELAASGFSLLAFSAMIDRNLELQTK